MEEEKKEVVENTEIEKKKKPCLFIRIINIILWLALFGWMSICIIDYFNVVNENEAQFCLEKETIEYDDGNVYVCRGFGYVAYHYDRKSFKGYEFAPFWTEKK